MKVVVLVLLILGVASCSQSSSQTQTVAQFRSTISSTSPLPTVVEPGLAYSEPCKPPCWQGLVPGQSTRQEAILAVEQVKASGWAKHTVVDAGIAVFPLLSSPSYSILLTFDSDVLAAIEGDVGFDYPVSTLVERFGSPERVYTFGMDHKHKLCSSCGEGQSFKNTTAVLLYSSQGLWFFVDGYIEEFGCVCPQMQVSAFYYFAPCSVQEVMSLYNEFQARLSSQPLDEMTEGDLVEWHGFGGGY